MVSTYEAQLQHTQFKTIHHAHKSNAYTVGIPSADAKHEWSPTTSSYLKFCHFSPIKRWRSQKESADVCSFWHLINTIGRNLISATILRSWSIMKYLRASSSNTIISSHFPFVIWVKQPLIQSYKFFLMSKLECL